jgi:hypothetical protein
MADTFTSALKIRKPATGQYSGSWGSVINSDAFQLFDTSIAGFVAVNLAGTAFSMPAMNNGADSASRYFCVQFTGAPSGPSTVTLPATVTSKFYLIDNQCGQNVIITYAGSTNTVTVAPGEKRLIWCDGTNTWNVLSSATDAATLAGVPAVNYARVTRDATEIAASTVVQNVFFGVTNSNPYATIPELPTTIIDCNTSNCQQLTLTGNRVMGLPVNPQDGYALDLIVIQDATGTRTLTWNAAFLFPGGTPPVLSVAPASIDRFIMVYNSGLAKWLVAVTLGVAAGSSASNTVKVNANTTGFNLLAALGTVVGSITATVIVAAGVVIQAVNTGTPAMDLSGLPAGSTVNLLNSGYIIGCGGDGADGAIASFPGSGTTTLSASIGKAGGNAIIGPGSSSTLNITNGNGHIWGGGGGGGGGGAYDGVSSGNGVGNAGGGGGGAGGGKGGKGGRGVYIAGGGSSGADGGPGSAGPAGIGGALGAPSTSGTGMAGVSAAGGTYGVAGATGTAPATVVAGHTGLFTAGGAAGKAIELLGAGAPTFLSGAGSPNVLGAVS